MSYSKIASIISANYKEIGDFLLSNIPDAKLGSISEEKIAINCPWCDDNRHRHKVLINLDYGGTFKCFRCGESGSLFKLLKEFRLNKEFNALLSSLTNISSFDLSNLTKSSFVEDVIAPIEVEDEQDKRVRQFIHDKGLLPIEALDKAYKYALSRVYNNEEEAKSYLCDEKYIYMPIIVNNKIRAFQSRLYIDDGSSPRYVINTLDKSTQLVAFIDDVLSNFTTNEMYITEGYFDSFAINYAMSNYVSICAFGKGKVGGICETLSENFSSNMKVYLTLDSVEKDKDIIISNIKCGKKISKYFPNLYIIELPEEDPADILKNSGPMKLKKILKDNAIPFLKYAIKNSLKF